MGRASDRLNAITEDIVSAKRFMEALEKDRVRDLGLSFMTYRGQRQEHVYAGDLLKNAITAEIREDFEKIARRAMKRCFGQMIEARKAAEEELASLTLKAEEAARDAGLGVNGKW